MRLIDKAMAGSTAVSEARSMHNPQRFFHHKQLTLDLVRCFYQKEVCNEPKSRMADLLTAVQTVSLHEPPPIEEIKQTKLTQKPLQEVKAIAITSPDDALQLLRSEPDLERLHRILLYIAEHRSTGYDIRIPSPQAAKIINELVTTIIPDYWAALGSDRKLLIRCLKNVAGIGALVTRLRSLLSSSNVDQQKEPHEKLTQSARNDLLSVLEQLLDGDDLVSLIWEQTSSAGSTLTQQRLIWKEFISTIGSGKVIAVVAEGEAKSSSISKPSPRRWLSNGPQYAAWLGRNVATMAFRIPSADQIGCAAVASLCSKALTLGYAESTVDVMIRASLLYPYERLPRIRCLAKALQAHDQRRFMELLLHGCRSLFGLDTVPGHSGEAIGKAAALISEVVADSTRLMERLAMWLQDAAGNCRQPVATRRAVIAVVSSETDRLQEVMEASMKLFGENLFIKHAPIVQQEACAQVLLLSAGYVHRCQPMFLFTLARSSVHMSGISNRLHSSSSRARVLGMVVSMAISGLVDKLGQRMHFDMEEVKTEEAVAYMNLVETTDDLGSLSDLMLKSPSESTSGQAPATVNARTGSVRLEGQRVAHPAVGKSKQLASTSPAGPRVVELLSEDDEVEDLIPYAKPEDDDDDDDEDPTLVHRNKQKPPVYIRDLLAGLQDAENFDRNRLALEHAAPLIRRKAQFGKEVSDHYLELGSILAGLGDTFDMSNFAELRLQALIALVVSNPSQVAPWYARQVFDGDYSLGQRATLLSALGLSARELAGYKDEDETLNPALPSSTPSFPSKKLPDRLHALYAPNDTVAPITLDRLSQRMEQTMIQPLAAGAADAASGPNALKVRTFSSRVTNKDKSRIKIIPNTLAKIVAGSFFFPLTGHWWSHARAYGPGGGRNVHMTPFLLSTYLKTLAIMLNAAGPGTLSLPSMTSEFWDLLLGLRMQATEDVSIMEAVLFSLLTVLEVNEDQRRVAEEHSKQLMETQEWVGMVFERTSGGNAEGDKSRMLAASVLLKTREVVEKYQRLLVGDMMSY